MKIKTILAFTAALVLVVLFNIMTLLYIDSKKEIGELRRQVEAQHQLKLQSNAKQQSLQSEIEAEKASVAALQKEKEQTEDAAKQLHERIARIGTKLEELMAEGGFLKLPNSLRSWQSVCLWVLASVPAKTDGGVICHHIVYDLQGRRFRSLVSEGEDAIRDDNFVLSLHSHQGRLIKRSYRGAAMANILEKYKIQLAD